MTKKIKKTKVQKEELKKATGGVTEPPFRPEKPIKRAL